MNESTIFSATMLVLIAVIAYACLQAAHLSTLISAALPH